MKPRDFCYWLQGHLEIDAPNGVSELSREQVQVIQDHLDLVFKKVTPDRKKVAEPISREDVAEQFKTPKWDFLNPKPHAPHIFPEPFYPKDGEFYCGMQEMVDSIGNFASVDFSGIAPEEALKLGVIDEII